ncbi:MAG TPA: DUF4406 domain-containing protein [Candidatus Saccharimonadales bacterium]|nr:DUF4406 domain-containing protein [Candidatus Saccharimonadales bacterium]
MLAYIAGPMRGYDLYNFPAFDTKALELRKKGWAVTNPAELDRVNHVHEFTDPLPPNFLRHAMARDCAAICKADAIVLLAGWEESRGVTVELALASLLKLRVFYPHNDIPTIPDPPKWPSLEQKTTSEKTALTCFPPAP